MKGFIYFSAKWCGPCSTLGPIMDTLQSQGIPVRKVDVDYDTQYVQEYNVRNVPTIVLFEEGRGELGRKVGIQSQQSLMEWFNNG